jgi:tRNA pseudouridine55 synthase
MNTDYSKGGMLLINKPLQWTSFDAVGKIRNILKHIYGHRLKVGHAGTLDPLATGLLIICTGSFTKRLNEFQDLEKEYEGVFTLGASRPSYDKETEITETSPVSHITEAMVQEAAKGFVGEIEQIPPAHSAIKIDGKRAYKKARQGKEVKMLPRTVVIKSFEVKLTDPNHIHFKVICEKGTYIRSLARDFGNALGSHAYLESLCRTRIGTFKLEDAINIDEVKDFVLQITHN